MPEGGNLFKYWKESENRRKIQFAQVMQERRKLKLTQSPHGSPKSESKSQSPPPTSKSPPPSVSESRFHTKRASVLVSSGSPMSAHSSFRTAHTVTDPRELVELERQKLHQIIEEEQAQIKEALER